MIPARIALPSLWYQTGPARPLAGVVTLRPHCITDLVKNPSPFGGRPMPRKERVAHILKIDSFRFDYSFGFADPKFSGEAYSEHLVVDLRVTVEKPPIRAKKGRIRCFASRHLVDTSNVHRHDAKPVGRVWYRGDDYQAAIFFPADMLPSLLAMLTAGKYRYLRFEPSGAHEDGIDSFSFSGYRGDEPEYLEELGISFRS